MINTDKVPLYYDAELPRIVHEILTGLDLPEWSVNVNNRKVLQGFYEGLGIADPLGGSGQQTRSTRSARTVYGKP